MASTPPPTSRVHTPPAPLHGARHDSWEPYSPRPTRAASKRNTSTASHLGRPSSSQQRTPSRLSAAKTKRTSSSHTLSPPSSPDHTTSHFDPFNDNTNFETNTSVATMLPTPAKTPRKRNQDTSMPTARLLNFQSGSLKQAMPTPRKQRKSRLTLLDEDAPESESFAVFTDAQDRVPDLDLSEDNPFVGPRRKDSPRSSSKQPQIGHYANMEEAMRDDQGVFYNFRGKIIFRAFEDADTGHEPDSGQASLKHQAGVVAHRPLTRSTIKPQLLWPSKDQLREKNAREAAINDDEEADTDIEQEEHLAPIMPATVKNLVTPAKKFLAQPADVLTPPSTHRATRSASKKLSFLSDFDTIIESGGPASPAPTPLPQQKSGAKRFSPFEAWQRTKSSFSSDTSIVGQGSKRPLSPQTDEQAVRKRTRNAASGHGRV